MILYITSTRLLLYNITNLKYFHTFKNKHQIHLSWWTHGSIHIAILFYLFTLVHHKVYIYKQHAHTTINKHNKLRFPYIGNIYYNVLFCVYTSWRPAFKAFFQLKYWLHETENVYKKCLVAWCHTVLTTRFDINYFQLIPEMIFISFNINQIIKLTS